MANKKIVITAGDPAGCGPRIALAAIDQLKTKNYDFFLVSDKEVLESLPLYKKLKKRFDLVVCPTPGISKLIPGKPSVLSGRASLDYLDSGLKFMADCGIKSLVTAPISKEAVSSVLPGFCGHTEYLSEYFSCSRFEMMMVSGKIKIILFTRHVSLSSVSSLIKKNALKRTFELVFEELKGKFKIKQPRIAVASFNPHAGLDTFLGSEEREVVAAIKGFQKYVYGPIASDTLFVPRNMDKYDCIICLYHDQGMIPFKLLSFKNGVNLTLGLPIIRTSPAHGTAFDLIRQGKIPSHWSMVEAIKLAAQLAP
jgi:4-hydroxythreonine-4-phosphate dehydrogenase